MNRFKNIYNYIKKNYIVIGTITSIVLLLFSFFAPILFTSNSFSSRFDFTNTGNIGDTIGIMNPFIAIIATISTFMAFYIQYKANQEVQKQFKIQQFESQFYEMLRLHKENVNEVSVTESKVVSRTMRNPSSSLVSTNGRKAFEELEKELKEIYNIVYEFYEPAIIDVNMFLNKAYHIFFFGINSVQNGLNLNYNAIKNKEFPENEKTIDHKIYEKVFNKANRSKKELYLGNSTYLAHLYRHLYLTVKFVANQDESFLSYEDKRKYLRILRAQLSNPEQALLFYNWKSGFGNQWENKKNKFFTDYRMIHNLYQDIILEDFDLEKIFDLKGNFKKERGRANDTLFEYQDWV